MSLVKVHSHPTFSPSVGFTFKTPDRFGYSFLMHACKIRHIVEIIDCVEHMYWYTIMLLIGFC